MPVRALLHAQGNTRPAAGDLDQILSLWRAGDGCLWLDVSEADPALLARLSREFRVHPGALAQVLNAEHRAHVREYRDHFFLQVPVPETVPGAEEPQGRARQHRRWRRTMTQELDAFVGRCFLLTVHARPMPVMDRVWDRYATGANDARAGHWPDLPLYSLCDELVRGFYPHLDWLEDEHDRAERLIFAPGRESPLSLIFGLKRDLLALRRVVAPLRDAMGSLSRRDFAYLGPDSRVLFADLYDRALRLLELEENLRDLFSGLVDAHLTVQNNRMNEVMKTLTVMATIMMPLTVLTGFFGMNFVHIPGLDSPLAFWVTTGSMVGLAVGMVMYFRRKGWW